MLAKDEKGYRPEYTLRASQLIDQLGEKENTEWKTIVWDEKSESLAVPNGSIGFRWDKSAKWNLETKAQGDEIQAARSLKERADDVVRVGFGYYGGEHDDMIYRKVPVKKIKLANGEEQLVATVFDLLIAQYGVDNGLDDENVAKNYFEDKPYTPAWQEKHTGVKPELVIQVAREFAQNAHDTKGRSMVIVGAGLNHWYHLDMNYRGLINMLMMCGTIGKSGGGWCHYVGQEKLRPQSGWAPLTFALDWHRPARQMAGTSFFYAHTGQYRHEKLGTNELLAPDATKNLWDGMTAIDLNAKAERMGWTPSAPQMRENPLDIADAADKAGISAADYIVRGLKDGSLDMSCNDPENPKKFPTQYVCMAFQYFGFVWQRARVFLEISARYTKRLNVRRRRLPETQRSEHGRSARGQIGFVHAVRFPYEYNMFVCRRDFSNRNLVRKTRFEYV